tara:strand:- start:5824 stop:6792 length:969 start_codon:yes stop_codon:yes gene_type:complete
MATNQKTKENNQKVGFEIEYIGVDLQNTAEIIIDVLGGHQHPINKDAIRIETEMGKFTIEKDAELLKKLAEKSKENSQNNQLDLEGIAEDLLNKLLGDYIPNEIVCPPIKINDIAKLDMVVSSLRDQGAKGTSSSLAYAFGLHINPEVLCFEAASILAHIQSFALLYDWMHYKMNLDFSRSISQFIKPYPAAYLDLINDSHYTPSMKQLMADYIAYVPTRNYALDLYPLFKHIDDAYISSQVDCQLINARPTYHFRMPNCRIDHPGWSLRNEWQYWVNIEKLSMNHKIRHDLMIQYKKEFSDPIRLNRQPWIKKVNQIVSAL